MRFAAPSHGIPIVAALLAVASVARADPPVWTFEVADVQEISRYEHTIRLIPAPPGIRYPRTCAEFVIHVIFEPGVGVNAYTVGFFTPDGYAKAIRMLRDAQASDKLARVGSLDTGFGDIEGKTTCEVASAGLGIMIADDGVPGVYSVF
jgi:hypothetical protein